MDELRPPTLLRSFGGASPQNRSPQIMERVKRFELSTSSLARKRSSQLSYTRITPKGGEELQPFERIVNA